jgi:hypothetical protein
MSYGFTSFFRQGAWLEFRRFILNQRRDVMARINTINAELSRIGNIQVLYERSATDSNRMSERRIGLNVTPNTSLENLLRAYIALGGNPFDISMFLSPDSVEVVEDEEAPTSQPSDPTTAGTVPVSSLRENQPYGGIAASGSTDPMTPGLYIGGWLPLWRYPPRRFGSRVSHTAMAADMTRTIHAARGWATQEIRTLRNDLEARVIKLMDLREQLMKERDELLPTAVGGSVPGLNWSNEGLYAVSHNVAMIVENIDAVFYPNRLEDGSRDFARPRVSQPNPEQPMLLDDAPNGEEDWTGIG